MTIGDISRKLELHFWDWAIPALSASPFTRVIVRKSFQIYHRVKPIRTPLLLVGVAIAGFSNGILLFFAFAR